uniref:Secreted protein n=1 Tax=Ixodes ricinus TaxID=34613 RepID=A0A6B0V9A4_IXORI
MRDFTTFCLLLHDFGCTCGGCVSPLDLLAELVPLELQGTAQLLQGDDPLLSRHQVFVTLLFLCTEVDEGSVAAFPARFPLHGLLLQFLDLLRHLVHVCLEGAEDLVALGEGPLELLILAGVEAQLLAQVGLPRGLLARLPLGVRYLLQHRLFLPQELLPLLLQLRLGPLQVRRGHLNLQLLLLHHLVHVLLPEVIVVDKGLELLHEVRVLVLELEAARLVLLQHRSDVHQGCLELAGHFLPFLLFLPDPQHALFLDELALPLQLPAEPLQLALGQQGAVALALQLLLLPRELAHLALCPLQVPLSVPPALLKAQVVLQQGPQLLLRRLVGLQELQHILHSPVSLAF